MSGTEMNERPLRLKRIRQVSGVMKWATTGVVAILILVGVFVVLGFVLPETIDIYSGEDRFEVGDVGRDMIEVPALQRIGLALLTAAGFGILIICTWRIRQLFGHFRQQDFFSSQTLSRIVSLGLWIVALGCYELVSDPIGTAIFTMDLPEGQRGFEITFDGGEIFSLIFGTIMILFGWIMREAASIQEENRQFI